MALTCRWKVSSECNRGMWVAPTVPSPSPISAWCHVAHKASTHFHPLSLPFTAALASFHISVLHVSVPTVKVYIHFAELWEQSNSHLLVGENTAKLAKAGCDMNRKCKWHIPASCGQTGQSSSWPPSSSHATNCCQTHLCSKSWDQLAYRWAGSNPAKDHLWYEPPP